MSPYPRALRIAVGLCLLVSGTIGLWLGVPPFAWGLYRVANSGVAPSIAIAITLILIAVDATQIVLGLWVLASDDFFWRVSVSWAAGVLLFFDALWAARNLSFLLLVVPQYVLTEMFFSSPRRAASYVTLTHDLLGVLGAVLLVWMILYRLLRRLVGPHRTDLPAA